MNEKFMLVERTPTLEEYQKLRKAVGWWDVETSQIHGTRSLT